MSDTTTRMNFQIFGTDVSASKAMAGVGKSAESMGTKIGGAFQTLGSKVGGELGEMFAKVGEGIEEFSKKSLDMGKSAMIAGAAIGGIGAALTLMGSKEKQATDQLKQAIDNTGESASAYGTQIEEAVKDQENFGHSASETKNALQLMVTATGDTAGSLKNLNLVADIAAAKHISLADAATLVAKVMDGNGAKVLKQFGITLDKSIKDPATQAQVALNQLSQQVDGQAAASVNNLQGKFEVAKVKVEDFVSAIGAKAGPAIMIAGGTIEAFGIIMETQMVQKSTQAAKGLIGIGDASISMGEKIGRASLAMGALGAALGIAVFVYDRFASQQDKNKDKVQGLTQALKEDTGELGKNSRAYVANALASDGVYKAAAKFGLTIQQVTDAAMGQTAAISQVNAVLKDHNSIADDHAASYTKVKNAIGDWNSSLKTAQEQQSETDQATGKATTTTEKATTAMDAAKDAAKADSDALSQLKMDLDKLNGSSVSLAEQQNNLTISLDGLKGKLDEHSHSLVGNTAAVATNQNALLDQFKAAEDIAVAQREAGDSAAVASGKYAANAAAIELAGVKAGLSLPQIKALEAQYKLTPAAVSTVLTADTSQAMAAVDALNARYKATGGNIGAIVTVAQSQHRRALGGTIEAGVSYLVGEHGPETITSNRAGYVNPSGAGGGGGGLTVNVTVQGMLSTPRDLTVAVEKAVGQAKAQGYRPQVLATV